MGNAFGVSRSSVSLIVTNVCYVIKNELKLAAEKFEEKHGILKCIGAIDGTHIFVGRPENNPTEVYSGGSTVQERFVG